MSDRERWAYEELQAGDVIQEGDQWLNPDGRWQAVVVSAGSTAEVWCARVRRPYRVSTILEIGDALAGAQKAATQLQSERDEFQTALIESRLALKRKVAEIMEVCKERDDALAALKSTQRARDELQRQVDELRADRRDEPTARQVQEVLRRWATELDWSADCFGSAGREQVHGVQNTLIAVMQRIESMIDPEGSHADD